MEVKFYPRGERVVTILSDADISKVEWTLQTVMAEYRPTKVLNISSHLTHIYFHQSTWFYLKLNSCYKGDYLGNNILNYLETADTPIVMLTQVEGSSSDSSDDER